ncbi:hypothetical protein B0H21DRAFT_823382 [Amylocystis lapponica]|nr:hypothetical protein B0H21DRAFT_823382 [Amylocystis lapponica]
MFARNATPLSPSLLKLEPEQRMRLIKSSQKVGKMLGATPIVDVVSPTASTFTPPMSPQVQDARSRRGAHFFGSLQSPVALFHSAASQVSAHEDAMNSPVVRYRVSHSDGRAMLRRTRVPAALSLAQPPRNEESPLSPFRYGLLRSPPSAFFSPKPVVPTFSPITDQKVQERKLEKLETLETLARAGSSLPQELVYPSLGQVGEKADQITSFLDFYRMGTKDDVHVPRAPSVVQDDQSVWSEVGVPDSTPIGRRMSRSLQASRRRSRSVGDFYSFGDALEIGSPRTYQTDKRFSRQLHSPSYIVPPPSAGSPMHPFANPCASPRVTLESPENMELPRRQRTESLKKAKLSIIGADAKLMADFRLGFGTRPLDLSLARFPAPTGPLPSPPVSARLQDVKSPKAPYWVKSSFRPRASFEFVQFAQADPYATARASPSRGPPPATPRTRRFERRQGWGGRWNQGNLGGVIDQLKEL